ncbi:hypothetical protein Tco_0132597 [Tanacetum coccineum]
MAFRNFIYAKNEEDLSFLPNEPSPGFGTGSPSVSMNTESSSVDAEPSLKLTEDTADSGGSPKPEVFVVHLGSAATGIKDKRCKTRGGSSRPHVKRKLAPWSLSSHATRVKTSSFKDDTPFLTVSDEDEGLPDVFELKDANACHLKISTIIPPSWKNHLDNHMDVELLDLHDRCYDRQAFLDNVVNRRSQELLQVIEKIRGECDVMKERKRAREELRSKCEAAMTNFEKHPSMVAIREKMSALSTKAKEHKANLDRMLLESQKWAGYQVSLSALESKVASLEAEKARLEAVEASLKKELDDVKRDRMEVVSKVVPYAALELVHSDELGRLVGKLVSSTVLYGRCAAFEQVADMKEPFDLSKVKGYRPSYKKEHTQAGNELVAATFSWLSEFVADPSAPIEVLLSKKPPTLQRHVPSKTHVPVPSSQRATPSSALASKPMSPPPTISSIKPQSSQGQ